MQLAELQFTPVKQKSKKPKLSHDAEPKAVSDGSKGGAEHEGGGAVVASKTRPSAPHATLFKFMGVTPYQDIATEAPLEVLVCT